MNSFAEFESAFLGALQQERSDLQSLQGASEAQLSAWIEHLFRQHLGYTHWKEITRAEGTPVGSKGGKQLFPDLRIDILDNGLIFIECKRLGRLDGPKGPEELDDGVSQLRSYIRAHLDRASIKPETVLGVVTDGNRWFLMGLNRNNEFHTIAEWAFLTDDPRLIAQRLWLLAKPALAQPTSALVEFLARRTVAEVLKEKTGWLTKKVNERLPDGNVSEELIGRWLRDAFSDPAAPPRLVPADSSTPPSPPSPQSTSPAGTELVTTRLPAKRGKKSSVHHGVTLADLISASLLVPPVKLFCRYKGTMLEATLLVDGAVEFQGQRYDTCSAAAEVARARVSGRQMNTNGWTFWRFHDGTGKRLDLDDARKRFIKTKSANPSSPPSPEPRQPRPLGGVEAMQVGNIAEAEGANPAVLSAAEQLKPLLALLPELTVNTSKATVSLYAGKLVVGYAHPRKRGLPRLRVYVGQTCPEWATPDPSYALWCSVGDWSTNLERVVALLKEAPRRRAEDMAAGRDPYYRRAQPPGSTPVVSAE